MNSLIWAQENSTRDDYDKFVNDNGRLMPFTVGYTRCDHDKGLWNEQCQDALVESIYGENWREIKEVILAFQRAIIHRDYRYIKGKTVIPKDKLAVFVDFPKENAKYSFEGEEEKNYILKEKKINELYFKRVPEKVLNIIKNTKYEDIYLDHERERGAVYLENRCKFRFGVKCIDIGNKRICKYLPKISSVRLDLTKFWK